MTMAGPVLRLCKLAAERRPRQFASPLRLLAASQSNELRSDCNTIVRRPAPFSFRRLRRTRRSAASTWAEWRTCNLFLGRGKPDLETLGNDRSVLLSASEQITARSEYSEAGSNTRQREYFQLAPDERGAVFLVSWPESCELPTRVSACAQSEWFWAVLEIPV